MSVIEAHALTKTYLGGDGAPITVLDGVDMTVDRGEMVAVIGASGAGKSTLLHLLGALDRPTGGSVRITRQELSGLNDDAVSALRNRTARSAEFRPPRPMAELPPVSGPMNPILTVSLAKAGSLIWQLPKAIRPV